MAAGSGSSGWRPSATGRRCAVRWVAPNGWPIPASRTPAHAPKTPYELIAELDQIFATSSLDEWAGVFAGEPDLFWSPVNTLEDVVADEQFHAAGGIVDVPEEKRTVPMAATPADFHGTPWTPRAARRNSARTPTKFSPKSKARRSS